MLLDVNLPDMHGTEVCRAVKARWGIPVVFTSSTAIPEEVAQMGDGRLTSLDQDDIVASVRNVRSRPARPLVTAEQVLDEPAVCRKTLFAPERRSSPEDLRAHASMFETGLVGEALDASAAPTLVLDRNRQIVFCNRAGLSVIGAADRGDVLGLRPGEALQCINASKGPDRCGTSEFCRTCGAVRAILEASRGVPDSQECRITRTGNGVEDTLEILVTASPCADGLLLCTFRDISGEIRRLALERVFFHDVLNVAGAVQALAGELSRVISDEHSDLANRIVQCTSQLLSEIRSQQLLLQAEANHLAVVPAPVGTLELVTAVVTQYRSHPVARDRTVRVDDSSEDVHIMTDPVILNRVLGNMLKNALEATSSGGTVTIGCQAHGDKVEFWVHNLGVMRRDLQLQVFQRSFSTKGAGRGLGTYSMKLLSERYLGGTVGFTSTAAHGTTFFARYPDRLRPESAGPTNFASRDAPRWTGTTGLRR